MIFLNCIFIEFLLSAIREKGFSNEAWKGRIVVEKYEYKTKFSLIHSISDSQPSCAKKLPSIPISKNFTLEFQRFTTDLYSKCQ